MDLATFFEQYGLILLLGALLVFMFWSSRRRMQKQKTEQEQKARQTIPGAKVLMQGGLYGTIVTFDAENLDQPAIVEIAPGVEIEVHSQAILRVVSDIEETADDDELVEVDETVAGYADGSHERIDLAADDTTGTVRDSSEPDSDAGTKPQA
ncbi:preprotein translocase subunit YajC [Microbacterium sp. NPDC076911]|uniref:preprotein translocase subunit YajC n=1 Tax=Microbacterium sp. NPDC076911 TaxID=3154958 RepID=UPI003434FEE7